MTDFNHNRPLIHIDGVAITLPGLPAFPDAWAPETLADSLAARDGGGPLPLLAIPAPELPPRDVTLQLPLAKDTRPVTAGEIEEMVSELTRANAPRDDDWWSGVASCTPDPPHQAFGTIDVNGRRAVVVLGSLEVSVGHWPSPLLFGTESCADAIEAWARWACAHVERDPDDGESCRDRRGGRHEFVKLSPGRWVCPCGATLEASP